MYTYSYIHEQERCTLGNIHTLNTCPASIMNIIYFARPVKPVSSSSLAVKEYVRAGAGHHVPTPDELRPPNILVKTMEYLVGRYASP